MTVDDVVDLVSSDEHAYDYDLVVIGTGPGGQKAAIAAAKLGHRVAIVGTDGITAAGGVTTHDETEARTNNAMVTHAQRVIVVADGSKIGKLALAQVATIDQVDLLVTDSSADPAALDAIRAAGVEVQVVEAV